MQLDVEAQLRRRYEGHIADIEIVDKEDLDLVGSHGLYAHILLLQSLFLVKYALKYDMDVSTVTLQTFACLLISYILPSWFYG